MRTTPAAQAPLLTGNFKCAVSQGKAGEGEVMGGLALRWFRNICPELEEADFVVLLSFLCRLGNWISHY